MSEVQQMVYLPDALFNILPTLVNETITRLAIGISFYDNIL